MKRAPSIHGPRLGGLKRRQLEKLIGTTLPPSASEIYFAHWQPSSDLAAYELYARFKTTHSDYLDLARRRGLTLFSESGPIGILPTRWKQTDEFEVLPWWDPKPETPPDAAAAHVGAYGWMITKYEDEHVYVMLTDTGHAAKPP